MYYVKKYSNGWAITNDNNGLSRLLTEKEIEKIKKEFPELEDKRVITLYIDSVKSILIPI
jgi:hypothetical protein